MGFKKIAPPDLDPDNPWKADLFGRGKIADSILSLLLTTNDPVVVGIHGQYGYGKTFLLRRISDLVAKDGWAIYVNAWEYDYLDNPTFALLDALKVAAERSDKPENALSSLKGVAAAAAPAIAKGVTKKVLGLALGDEGTKELIEAISEGGEKALEKLIKSSFDSNTTAQSLQAFRDKVREFVAKNGVEKSPYPCLVIIVDELDRAKPDFSIAFLETIKHLFATAQVVFLIGCDRDVLASSAKHQFGDGLNVDGYFRRLFDYWIELPKPDAKAYALECARKLNLVSDKILVNDSSVINGVIEYADSLSFALGESPSLRVIEQLVAEASLIFRQTRIHSGLLGLLQGMRQTDPDFFRLYTSDGHVGPIYQKLLESRFSKKNHFLTSWAMLWAHNGSMDLKTYARELLHSNKPVAEKLEQIISGNQFIDLFDSRNSMAFLAAKQLLTITPGT